MINPLPAADALFGKTRQAVLALLFGNPGRAYYTREIVHHADSGGSQVQRELAKLTRAGLVTRERRANQVYFQANPKAAIYRELVELVTKSFGIADIVRAALVPLGGRIRVALIYGSVARGEHGASSDIDLLIVGDVLLSDLDQALESAEKRLARTISPTVMDWPEFARRRKANEHFLRTVMAGSKIYLVGDASLLKVPEDADAG